MKFGILGSGMVATTIGAKLIELGHEVMLGTRSPDKLRDWAAQVGGKAQIGSFEAAARHGDWLVNATSGSGALEALKLAGEANLNGKILIDISNPLDFSQGMPPTLFVCNTDSLGEQIQRTYPQAKVVKTFNTLTAALMVDPQSLSEGEHTLFICGDDPDAKAQVIEFLSSEMGWRDVIDLGDISSARATEMLLPLWIRLYMKFGTPRVQFKIVR